MTPEALGPILADIATEIAAASERGRPAHYIPELACGDVGRFGIAVALGGDRVAMAGEAEAIFSIQSISKVFTLSLALDLPGLWTRVGCEPSGNPFNSIVQLEAERGRPRNPFINAGAIVVADMLRAAHGDGALAAIRGFVASVGAGEAPQVDAAVARSEWLTAHRNRSLAYFMASERNLSEDVEAVLGLYIQQCALAMSCRTLALAGRYLAFPGAHGPLSPAAAARVCALMLTCGHYDGSGDFACRVGLPGKSGVGGGILAIAPGVASIAAWSPGLGKAGNSLLATRALELLAARTGWSVFAPLQAGAGQGAGPLGRPPPP